MIQDLLRNIPPNATQNRFIEIGNNILSNINHEERIQNAETRLLQ